MRCRRPPPGCRWSWWTTPRRTALPRRCGAPSPRSPWSRSERNLGAAGRNAGVRAARTPYVALCDDDAWWAPGALARAAHLLDVHPTLAVVCARVLVGPDAHEN